MSTTDLEKKNGLAILENIKACIAGGLFFGEHAGAIAQCQAFLDVLIAKNRSDLIAVVPDLPKEEVVDGKAD